MTDTTNAIRAGSAFVQIFADKSPLVRDLKSVGTQINDIGKDVMGFGKKIVAATAFVGAGLLASVKIFSDSGDAVQKMSIRTGVSAEALSELGSAAKTSGTDLQTLEGGFRKMQKFLVEAAQSSGDARDTIQDLGLSVGALSQMSPDEQFKTIADEIARIQDPARKSAVVMKIFGRTGADLIPLLNEGSAGIENLQRHFRGLGLTMSTEMANSAADVNDRLDELTAVVKRSAIEIGYALAPTVITLATNLTNAVVGINAFIAAHHGMVTTVAEGTVVLGAAGVAVYALGAGITAVGTTVTSIGKGIAWVGTVGRLIGTGLTAALAAIPTAVAGIPIGVIAAVAALTALGIGLYATSGGSDSAAKSVDRLTQNANRLTQALNDASAARARFAAASGKGDSNGQETSIDDEKKALENAKDRLTARRDHLQRPIMKKADALEVAAGLDLDPTVLDQRDPVKDDMAGVFSNHVRVDVLIAAIEKKLGDLGKKQKSVIDEREARKARGGMDAGDYTKAMKALDEERDLINARSIEDPQTREIALTRLQFYKQKQAVGFKGPVNDRLNENEAAAVDAIRTQYKRASDKEYEQLKIAGIEDAQGREVASVNAHYGTLIDAARTAGESTVELERNKEQAIKNIHDQYARQTADEYQQLQIASIEGSEQQELASVRARYDKMIKIARDAGQSVVELERNKELAIKNIQENAQRSAADRLRQLVIAGIRDPFKRTLAEIEADFGKAIKDAVGNPKEQATLEAARKQAVANAKQSREDSLQGLKDEIEKLQTQLDTRNQPREVQDQAQRDLERRIAIRDAEKNGLPVDLIEKLFDLRDRVANLGTIETRGTFNPKSLQSLQAGSSSPQERTAKASERTAENTANIASLSRKTIDALIANGGILNFP